MKLKNITQLLLLATVILFLAPSCVKEGPIGLTGPAGADGNDGKDANETCKMCHNPTKVEAIATQYEFSKHSFGAASEEETGRVECAPCHQSEGFKYVIKNNISTAFTAVNGCLCEHLFGHNISFLWSNRVFDLSQQFTFDLRIFRFTGINYNGPSSNDIFWWCKNH